MKITPTEAFARLRAAVEKMAEIDAKGAAYDRDVCDGKVPEDFDNFGRSGWMEAFDEAIDAFRFLGERPEILDDIEGLLDTIYGGSAG